jgi:hypothetical protein
MINYSSILLSLKVLIQPFIRCHVLIPVNIVRAVFFDTSAAYVSVPVRPIKYTCCFMDGVKHETQRLDIKPASAPRLYLSHHTASTSTEYRPTSTFGVRSFPFSIINQSSEFREHKLLCLLALYTSLLP